LFERDFHLDSKLPFDFQFSEVAGCGQSYDPSREERHQLWIAEPWEVARRLDLRVVGGEAHLDEETLVERSMSSPRVGASAQQAASHAEQSARVTRKTLKRIPLEELAGLRSAWTAPKLWQVYPEAQTLHTGCLDGRTTVLASCVGGELEVRMHRCSDEADAAIDRLVEEFQPLLDRANPNEIKQN
jgi:hypothetical protein